MKRFYETACRVLDPASGHHVILLDGRPVKTPLRASLAVPGEALAEAIVGEWSEQGERIDPATMPMTGFANASIDQVLGDARGFAATIAAYGTHDLLCYRADAPPPLVALQAEHWDPLLDWARARLDVHVAVTSGIMPIAQPSATVARLAAAVDALDPWLLAGFSAIVSISGTLIGALALLEGGSDVETLWTAATLDEAFQAAQWGADTEAEARLAARRADCDAAVRYCALVQAA